LEADPSSAWRNPPAWGTEGGLGQGGQLAQGRRRAVLGLAQQGDPCRGPAGEPPVGVGVGVADHRPQVRQRPLERGVEGQGGAVVAGGQGDLVAEVEAEPEPVLQLQVGGDPAAAEAAVLVGADLEAAAAAGQFDGVDAAAGGGGRLQHDHVQPGPGQVAGAHQPVVPAPDHHHLGPVHRGHP
jgi:hypothetical protein